MLMDAHSVLLLFLGSFVYLTAVINAQQTSCPLAQSKKALEVFMCLILDYNIHAR